MSEMESQMCKCGHEFRDHVAVKEENNGGFGCLGNERKCTCTAFVPA